MTRIVTYTCALFTFACLSSPIQAQDSKAAIQQRLVAKYALTKPTAKLDDIVTAGSVLVLKKDNLVMVPVTDRDLNQSTYKNGRIGHNALGGLKQFQSYVPGASKVVGGDTRTFVTGEKVWVTAISATDKGIVFNLFTDAFSDVRYKAALMFPASKDASADQVEKTVAEVFDIQANDDAKKDQPQPQQGVSAPQPSSAPVVPAPAEVPPAPIAPPPPPPDAPAVQPPTVEVGQTTEQVVAVFGQPVRVMKTATKQIYVYKDVKVTFVKGKVTDVQ